MRKAFIIFSIIITIQTSGFSQQIVELSSVIKKVTVYKKGAQIENEAILSLIQGRNVVKLTGLSPYIDKQSIRITGDGSFTLLNVQSEKDFLNQVQKTKEIEAITGRIEIIRNGMEEEETRTKIIREKLDFLGTNKNIGGNNQPVDPETFKTMNVYYGDQIEALNLEILKKGRIINEYQKELTQLQNQLNQINSKSDLPTGTITITIDSKQTKKSTLLFSYRVVQATWYPSYDIRYTGMNKPLLVTYKANISQNSGIDWKNVQIVLSTANTDISAQIPEFSPYYLHFYYPELAYAMRTPDTISKQFSPGTAPTFRIRGITTVNNNDPLYVVDGVITSEINSLNPNDIASIELLKDASTTAIYGSQGSNGVVKINTRKNDYETTPVTIMKKRVTSNEYLIECLQSIISNNQITSMNFREIEMNADFDYQSVPFATEHVFLIGKIADWYEAEFMDGKANIYLENSYVGETSINALQYTDTMEISFGVDNNISIKRDKVKEFSESKLMGAFKKQTVGYKITLRNNKPYAITTRVTEQIPVSTTREITIDPVEISGGNLEAVTGKVFWDVLLEPGSTKEIFLKYQVRYPKNKQVIIQ